MIYYKIDEIRQEHVGAQQKEFQNQADLVKDRQQELLKLERGN